MNKILNSSSLLFLIRVLRNYLLIITVMGCVSFVYAIEMCARAYLIKNIINLVHITDSSHIMTTLMLPISLYMGLGVLTVLIFRIYDFMWLKLNTGLKHTLGFMLMEYMMRHSHSVYLENFAGNLGTKIKDVMSGVPDIIRTITQNFLSHFFSIILGVITLFFIHKGLSFALLVWSVFFVSITFYFAKQGQKVTNASAHARSLTMGHIIDTLSNMMSVRLFNTSKGEQAHLRKSLDNYVIADQNRDWFFMKAFTIQGLSFVIYQGVCLWILIKGYEKGTLTAGDFALVLTLNIALVDRLWSLFSDIGQLTVMIGDVGQGLRIALSPIEITEKENAKNLILRSGDIVFEHVSFQYQKSHDLFKDLSVRIPAGQKVGLVGYSGSGKTTFVHLLLRLFDVTTGRILIDGQDIRDVTLQSLYRSIAMVPQDPSLFHRSFMDNIRYSRHDASDEDVFNAARLAHAHDFIRNIPENYKALVGERGVKLSGGQRQRIAIARAFLKNAPILIFDEATSQLDSMTEAVIQESLLNLMQDKTTFVIAHRLSTLLHLDRILVFDKGKIVQDGIHTDLIKQNGLYKQLWNTQVAGFLPEERH